MRSRHALLGSYAPAAARFSSGLSPILCQLPGVTQRKGATPGRLHQHESRHPHRSLLPPIPTISAARVPAARSRYNPRTPSTLRSMNQSIGLGRRQNASAVGCCNGSAGHAGFPRSAQVRRRGSPPSAARPLNPTSQAIPRLPLGRLQRRGDSGHSGRSRGTGLQDVDPYAQAG